jgi:hypothetical protein
MQTLRSLAILPALMVALGLATLGISLSVAPAGELKLSTVMITVIDSATNAPLVRASVLLERNKGAFTNDQGVVTFKKVKPGSYDLKISYVGYDEVRLQGFKVADSLVSHTVAMSSAKADSMIIVNGKRIMVEKSKTEEGRKFSGSEVQNTRSMGAAATRTRQRSMASRRKTW